MARLPSAHQPERFETVSHEMNDEDKLALFSQDHYRALFAQLKRAGYQSVKFEALSSETAEVYIRHDVDYSVEAALEVARWDADLGLSTDFFVMVDTAFYSVGQTRVRHQLREIRALGHRIGLHFDQGGMLEAGEEVGSRARIDAEILSLACGENVEVLTFHRPTRRAHGGGVSTAPIRHPRDSPQLRAVEYISDSRGLFRFGSPIESASFRNRKPLHLLLHPIWWVNHREHHSVAILESFLIQRSNWLRHEMMLHSTPFAEHSRQGGNDDK